MHQAYKAAEAAAAHPGKQWSFGWPLLGVADPDGPGSVLPNLVIKLVDPDTITLSDVVPGSPTLATLVN